MNTHALERQFEKMGARIKVEPTNRNWRGNFSVDVQRDRKGEFFLLRHLRGAELDISTVDVRPKDRHLLLSVREAKDKHKFLCGHDERHWFVAAVPGQSVRNVSTAMEALKPETVRSEQSRRPRVATTGRKRRKNKIYIRQGEWFFVPADINPPKIKIFRNEPIQRGDGGKPHMCEFLYRSGGETVYVCSRFPNGLTEKAYKESIQRDPRVKRFGWRTMRRNASVYVKGRISHADHKTVILDGWHRVMMNRETEAPSMRAVAFLD